MQSNLWIFPRGTERNGVSGKNTISWTFKYGSVVVSAYEIGTADGVNEKALVANLLYLVESNYGNPGEKSTLSVSTWAQYVLDNFATVAEVVEAFSNKNSPHVIGVTLPNGSVGNLHLSVSDSTGDSAIFEYINGELKVHHGKEYITMTNSPQFDQQLALNTYWKDIGGLVFMPGTNRAADRFVRTDFLINAIPKKILPNYKAAVINGLYINQAVASVVSVMRSISVPFGITVPNQPNIASTLWRTITDHKNKIYYFDSSTTPNIFWVSLDNIDFKEGMPVKKLSIAKGEKILSGEVSNYFESAEPFKFLAAQPK